MEMSMKFKPDLNTILLSLILVVIIAGSVIFIGAVRRLVEPLARVERTIDQRIESIIRPTPTVIADPVTIVREIRSLSRLEAVSFTIEKVITAESGQGPFAFLFGDRLILVAHGQVIAGIDLEDMAPEDFFVTQDGKVLVILPQPEVFVVALSNQKSYIYDRDTGVIGMNPGLETTARQAAEDEILAAALEDDILEMARGNAEQTIRQFILALGFDEVVFVEATPAPATSGDR
jgi:hypothetical protein